MSDVEPKHLAECKGKGYVIAPAGYGKSHLITMAVKLSQGKQLVLTHTFAGVSSIKGKMRSLAVSSKLCQVDTLASWALGMCLDYPKTSGWDKLHPEGAEWNRVYEHCTKLLEKKFFQHIIKCSYSGVYVDEYQDCSKPQHAMICALASLLPCRILGDPMQAIFGFNEELVDWETSIKPFFLCLGQLTKPWRWHNAGYPDLGSWLDDARQKLIDGQPIRLAGQLPRGVSKVKVDLTDFTDRKRLNLFYDFSGDPGSVTAIYPGQPQSKNKAHKLAQSLGGRFSSIEEVEGKDLLAFVRKLDKAASSRQRLCDVISFTKKCCNSIDSVLTAQMKRGETTKIIRSTKFPIIAVAANDYLIASCTAKLAGLLVLIQQAPEVTVYRRDLLNRLTSVLSLHQQDRGLSLEETALLFQRSMRNTGRPIRHNKVVATTLLVKGLEFDHVIVLEADTMACRDLYVALTRGAKSVTIVCNSDSIGTISS